MNIYNQIGKGKLPELCNCLVSDFKLFVVLMVLGMLHSKQKSFMLVINCSLLFLMDGCCN